MTDRDITHHKFSSDDLTTATPEQLLKYLSVWRETKLIPQETINDIVLQILTNLVSRLDVKPTPEPVSGELKPCPSCGNRAYELKGESDPYYIQCETNGCSWSVHSYESREAARAMWNKRVTITPTPVSGNAQQEITRLTYRLAVYTRAVKAMREHVVFDNVDVCTCNDCAELRTILAEVKVLEKE